MAENDQNVEIKNESDDSFEGYVGLPAKPKSKAKKRIQIRKQGECVECKKQKEIHAKNMCAACYQRAFRRLPEHNVPNCCRINCDNVLTVDKHGRCRKCSDAKSSKERRSSVTRRLSLFMLNLFGLCYDRSKTKTKGTCHECGQMNILENKKTCGNCQRRKRAKADIRMCHNCGEFQPHCADQMCRKCYNKTRKEDLSKHGECTKCGETKFIVGHGMCGSCCVQTTKEDTTKHKKSTLIPKSEPVSDAEAHSVSQISIEDLKMEELDDQKPGPSGKD